MRTQRMLTSIALALAVMPGFPGVSAQEKGEKKRQAEPQVVRQEVVIKQDGPIKAATLKGDDTFVFVSSEMSFGGKVVKNAPYSAQAVTETVQTLGDGNRIVRKNTASVYRDSEGRTRRDQEIGAIGPFASAGEPSRTAFINDPVAKANYILDPRTKTARKLPGFDTFSFGQGGGKGATGFKFEVHSDGDKHSAAQTSAPRSHGPKDGEQRGFVFNTAVPPPGPGMPEMEFHRYSSKADTKTEKLDSRTIEGVQAEGTRTTTTIPAGEIGNEQPIQIVNERWYSPELQTVVMTRHSDPRFGETTYRLTGINRSEPSPTLFQIPGDYTVKEAPTMMRGMRMRHPMPPPPPEN
ncbi:MAG: hypothetical protein LC754_12800 [Acidobacteria bacterium]|nr:hypothetical protein [Acidobacteriota bacterium]